MVRSPRFLFLAGLATAAIALPFGARAQVNPFASGSGAGPRNSDFTAMDNAARKLAAQGNPADGTSEPWSNPHTGASGTVTVESTFHEKGMLCRKVAYRAKKAHETRESTMNVNWCHTPQGWKML